MDLEEAVRHLLALEAGSLTRRLSSLESLLCGQVAEATRSLCAQSGIDESVLQAAFVLKAGAGQKGRSDMRTWMYDPHSGGVKIPPPVRLRTEQRIRAHANASHAGQFVRLDIRFRGALCYIDAYTESSTPPAGLLRALDETREQYLERPSNAPLHLCRLRYFGNEEAWSLAFYTYSYEKYEPCIFPNGTFYGTPEEAFEVGALLC